MNPVERRLISLCRQRIRNAGLVHLVNDADDVVAENLEQRFVHLRFLLRTVSPKFRLMAEKLDYTLERVW